MERHYEVLRRENIMSKAEVDWNPNVINLNDRFIFLKENLNDGWKEVSSFFFSGLNV